MTTKTRPADNDIRIIELKGRDAGCRPWEVFFGHCRFERFDTQDLAYEAARRWAYASGVSIWTKHDRGNWLCVPVSALLH